MAKTPKERKATYRAKPEVKAKEAAYAKAYIQRPGMKERKREILKAWLRKHPEYAATKMRGFKAKARQMMRDYKASYGCVDCGEKDPIVLEFDHIDRSKKKFNIGIDGWWKSLDELSAEMSKCEVRCANCHRRKTHFSRDWRSVRETEKEDDDYQLEFGWD